MSKDLATIKALRSPATAKSLAVAYLLLLFGGIYLMVKAVGIDPFSGNHFVVENWGRVLSLAALAVLILLTSIQRNLFWDFGRRSSQLDEREVALRRKIFERSYKLTLLTVAICLYALSNHQNWLINNLHSGDMGFIALDVLMLLFAFPPLVAAGQKGSLIATSGAGKSKTGVGSWIIRIWLASWLIFILGLAFPNGAFLMLVTVVFGIAGLLTLPVVLILAIRFLRNNQ